MTQIGRTTIRLVWVALFTAALAACGRSNIPAPVINGGAGSTAPAASAGPGGTVTVRNGDSLYRIARRHSVGLRGLIDVNRMKPPYTIFPGQTLKLPGAAAGGYVVASGDTVYSVAEQHNVEPGALVRANDLEPPYRLGPGQTLRIPSPTARTPPPTQTQTASSIPRPATRPGTPSSPAENEAVSASRRPVVRRPPSTASISPPSRSGEGFIWPVNGKTIAKFGSIGKGLKNDGINILAERGTPVRAIENGVVAYAGNELRGFGNLLLLKHDDGWISAYAHNDTLLVNVGDRVSRGQVISRVGSTGSVDTPQLHFELRRGNRAVDPERYLGRRTALFEALEMPQPRFLRWRPATS
ncbi:MAG: M23 family metallopeptidase [Alphaproteobacteria bacterium]